MTPRQLKERLKWLGAERVIKGEVFVIGDGEAALVSEIDYGFRVVYEDGCGDSSTVLYATIEDVEKALLGFAIMEYDEKKFSKYEKWYKEWSKESDWECKLQDDATCGTYTDLRYCKVSPPVMRRRIVKFLKEKGFNKLRPFMFVSTDVYKKIEDSIDTEIVVDNKGTDIIIRQVTPPNKDDIDPNYEHTVYTTIDDNLEHAFEFIQKLCK